jgi:hypothetical protein
MNEYKKTKPVILLNNLFQHCCFFCVMRKSMSKLMIFCVILAIGWTRKCRLVSICDIARVKCLACRVDAAESVPVQGHWCDWDVRCVTSVLR